MCVHVSVPAHALACVDVSTGWMICILGSPKSYFIFSMSSHYNSSETFVFLSNVATYLIRVNSTSKHSLRNIFYGVFYQLPSYLLKFYPGTNSSSRTTSFIRLNHHPYLQSAPYLSSLVYNSIWYGTHHIATWSLASCAVVQCVNCWSINSL